MLAVRAIWTLATWGQQTGSAQSIESNIRDLVEVPFIGGQYNNTATFDFRRCTPAFGEPSDPVSFDMPDPENPGKFLPVTATCRGVFYNVSLVEKEAIPENLQLHELLRCEGQKVDLLTSTEWPDQNNAYTPGEMMNPDSAFWPASALAVQTAIEQSTLQGEQIRNESNSTARRRGMAAPEANECQPGGTGFPPVFANQDPYPPPGTRRRRRRATQLLDEMTYLELNEHELLRLFVHGTTEMKTHAVRYAEHLAATRPSIILGGGKNQNVRHLRAVNTHRYSEHVAKGSPGAGPARPRDTWQLGHHRDLFIAMALREKEFLRQHEAGYSWRRAMADVDDTDRLSEMRAVIQDAREYYDATREVHLEAHDWWHDELERRDLVIDEVEQARSRRGPVTTAPGGHDWRLEWEDDHFDPINNELHEHEREPKGRDSKLPAWLRYQLRTRGNNTDDDWLTPQSRPGETPEAFRRRMQIEHDKRADLGPARVRLHNEVMQRIHEALELLPQKQRRRHAQDIAWGLAPSTGEQQHRRTAQQSYPPATISEVYDNLCGRFCTANGYDDFLPLSQEQTNSLTDWTAKCEDFSFAFLAWNQLYQYTAKCISTPLCRGGVNDVANGNYNGHVESPIHQVRYMLQARSNAQLLDLNVLTNAVDRGLTTTRYPYGAGIRLRESWQWGRYYHALTQTSNLLGTAWTGGHNEQTYYPWVGFITAADGSTNFPQRRKGDLDLSKYGSIWRNSLNTLRQAVITVPVDRSESCLAAQSEQYEFQVLNETGGLYPLAFFRYHWNNTDPSVYWNFRINMGNPDLAKLEAFDPTFTGGSIGDRMVSASSFMRWSRWQALGTRNSFLNVNNLANASSMRQRLSITDRGGATTMQWDPPCLSAHLPLPSTAPEDVIWDADAEALACEVDTIINPNPPPGPPPIYELGRRPNRHLSDNRCKFRSRVDPDDPSGPILPLQDKTNTCAPSSFTSAGMRERFVNAPCAKLDEVEFFCGLSNTVGGEDQAVAAKCGDPALDSDLAHSAHDLRRRLLQARLVGYDELGNRVMDGPVSDVPYEPWPSAAGRARVLANFEAAFCILPARRLNKALYFFRSFGNPASPYLNEYECPCSETSNSGLRVCPTNLYQRIDPQPPHAMVSWGSYAGCARNKGLPICVPVQDWTTLGAQFNEVSKSVEDRCDTPFFQAEQSLDSRSKPRSNKRDYERQVGLYILAQIQTLNQSGFDCTLARTICMVDCAIDLRTCKPPFEGCSLRELCFNTEVVKRNCWNEKLSVPWNVDQEKELTCIAPPFNGQPGVATPIGGAPGELFTALHYTLSEKKGRAGRKDSWTTTNCMESLVSTTNFQTLRVQLDQLSTNNARSAAQLALLSSDILNPPSGVGIVELTKANLEAATVLNQGVTLFTTMEDFLAENNAKAFDAAEAGIRQLTERIQELDSTFDSRSEELGTSYGVLNGQALATSSLIGQISDANEQYRVFLEQFVFATITSQNGTQSMLEDLSKQSGLMTESLGFFSAIMDKIQLSRTRIRSSIDAWHEEIYQRFEVEGRVPYTTQTPLLTNPLDPRVASATYGRPPAAMSEIDSQAPMQPTRIWWARGDDVVVLSLVPYCDLSWVTERVQGGTMDSVNVMDMWGPFGCRLGTTVEAFQSCNGCKLRVTALVLVQATGGGAGGRPTADQLLNDEDWVLEWTYRGLTEAWAAGAFGPGQTVGPVTPVGVGGDPDKPWAPVLGPAPAFEAPAGSQAEVMAQGLDPSDLVEVPAGMMLATPSAVSALLGGLSNDLPAVLFGLPAGWSPKPVLCTFSAELEEANTRLVYTYWTIQAAQDAGYSFTTIIPGLMLTTKPSELNVVRSALEQLQAATYAPNPVPSDWQHISQTGASVVQYVWGLGVSSLTFSPAMTAFRYSVEGSLPQFGVAVREQQTNSPGLSDWRQPGQGYSLLAKMNRPAANGTRYNANGQDIGPLNGLGALDIEGSFYDTRRQQMTMDAYYGLNLASVGADTNDLGGNGASAWGESLSTHINQINQQTPIQMMAGPPPYMSKCWRIEWLSTTGTAVPLLEVQPIAPVTSDALGGEDGGVGVTSEDLRYAQIDLAIDETRLRAMNPDVEFSASAIQVLNDRLAKLDIEVLDVQVSTDDTSLQEPWYYVGNPADLMQLNDRYGDIVAYSVEPSDISQAARTGERRARAGSTPVNTIHLAKTVRYDAVTGDELLDPAYPDFWSEANHYTPTGIEGMEQVPSRDLSAKLPFGVGRMFRMEDVILKETGSFIRTQPNILDMLPSQAASALQSFRVPVSSVLGRPMCVRSQAGDQAAAAGSGGGVGLCEVLNNYAVTAANHTRMQFRAATGPGSLVTVIVSLPVNVVQEYTHTAADCPANFRTRFLGSLNAALLVDDAPDEAFEDLVFEVQGDSYLPSATGEGGGGGGCPSTGDPVVLSSPSLDNGVNGMVNSTGLRLVLLASGPTGRPCKPRVLAVKQNRTGQYCFVWTAPNNNTNSYGQGEDIQLVSTTKQVDDDEILREITDAHLIALRVHDEFVRLTKEAINNAADWVVPRPPDAVSPRVQAFLDSVNATLTNTSWLAINFTDLPPIPSGNGSGPPPVLPPPANALPEAEGVMDPDPNIDNQTQAQQESDGTIAGNDYTVQATNGSGEVTPDSVISAEVAELQTRANALEALVDDYALQVEKLDLFISGLAAVEWTGITWPDENEAYVGECLARTLYVSEENATEALEAQNLTFYASLARSERGKEYWKGLRTARQISNEQKTNDDERLQGIVIPTVAIGTMLLVFGAGGIPIWQAWKQGRMGAQAADTAAAAPTETAPLTQADTS